MEGGSVNKQSGQEGLTEDESGTNIDIVVWMEQI